GDRPGSAMVGRAHDGQRVLPGLLRLLAGSVQEGEAVHQRAVGQNGDLVADGLLVRLRGEYNLVRLPGRSSIRRSGQERVATEGKAMNGVEIRVVTGVVEAIPNDVGVPGLGRVGGK